MKLVFVDTGAFYALADRRDPAHARAVGFYEESNELLLTTDYVFAETMSLLTKRLRKKTAIEFGTGIRNGPRFRIEEVSPDLREAAWELFCKRADKKYDLIDCTSFVTMERFGLSRAFGFDRHFVQHGFELTP